MPDPVLDPKQQPGAYIALGDRLYEVIGRATPSSTLLEVENVKTLHRVNLALFEVAQSRLIRAAAISDLETLIAQTQSIADPDEQDQA